MSQEPNPFVTAFRDPQDAVPTPPSSLEKMHAALLIAKETIRALHGEEAWEIYDHFSPEMRVINVALDLYP